MRPLRLSKHNVVYYPFETKLTFRTPSQTSTWVSFPQMQDGPTYVLGREAKKVVGDWYCVDKVKKQREIDPALKESIKNALGSLNYHWIGNNINQLYGKTPDAIWELVRGILSRNPKVTSPQV